MKHSTLLALIVTSSLAQAGNRHQSVSTAPSPAVPEGAEAKGNPPKCRFEARGQFLAVYIDKKHVQNFPNTEPKSAVAFATKLANQKDKSGQAQCALPEASELGACSIQPTGAVKTLMLGEKGVKAFSNLDELSAMAKSYREAGICSNEESSTPCKLEKKAPNDPTSPLTLTLGGKLYENFNSASEAKARETLEKLVSAKLCKYEN